MANIFETIGATRYCIERYSSSRCLMLMYHRIMPNKNVEYGLQAGMYVEPETFEMHIHYLKKHFRVIPMKGFMEFNNNSFKIPAGIPLCILTFDDGWSDFYTNAYPILKANGVHATVFLPTEYIGTEKRFWTDSVTRLCYGRERGEGYLQKKPKSSNPVIDLLENGSGSMEIRLDKAIEKMKALPQEEINRVLADLSERWEIDPTSHGREFLTWDEVREMHRSGLVSFGSHTGSHKILTALRDDEIDFELRQSKNRLLAEGVVDPSCLPFAYPNGNHNDRIVALVKKHGYSLAVTTKKGWVRYSDKAKMFELDRIGIHQDMASTGAMFGCRILQVI